MVCVVLGCVAPLRFSFSVSPTCRCSVRALFRASSSFYSGSPLTRLCVHCPSREFGGLRQLPPSRDLATPHPFVSYVVWLLAQSDMPVRWEDVHISSIGSKFGSTHPFSILLLTHVILPRLWRQRNDVRKLERSRRYLMGLASVVAFCSCTARRSARSIWKVLAVM